VIASVAKSHFTTDIARARAILTHSNAQLPGILKDDMLRAAWMMAVGACDAYFCDAYVDALARTLRAKDAERAVKLPEKLENLEVPISTAFHVRASAAWKWRMFARAIMERETVLAVAKIKELLDPFCRKDHKFITTDTIESWIVHPTAKSRLFGVTASAYRAAGAKKKGLGKGTAAKKAFGTGKAAKAAISKGAYRQNSVAQLKDRYWEIFQRRHDCIHTCDRPKVAIQSISNVATEKAIDDIDFLVSRCHDHLAAEYPAWLKSLGFSALTRNSVTTP
jgi:hypothetical protein